jgi:DNA (cytosine-5)-methyltransferase 1
MQNQLNTIDLFCGCGGLTKGLVDAGLNVIAGIDIWSKAVESYNKNYEHNAYCEDLTKLTPQEFNEKYNKNNKNINIIVGGPPCQSFSIAGKRDKNDPRNTLFMEYVKYLDYFKPEIFMMENVIGILSKKTMDGTKVIDIIMEQLEQHYNCIITKLYASDFEVPQNRRRTIIIGIRKDLEITPREPIPIIMSIENRIPVKHVLLPIEQIELSNFLSDKAIQGIINKKKKSKENGHGFGAQFLDLNKPSYTISARYWKDGYDALVKYDDNKIRRLTIIELKRIQSFPDNYIICGSKKDIIMQIGNAVACKFAYHLGIHIKNIIR